MRVLLIGASEHGGAAFEVRAQTGQTSRCGEIADTNLAKRFAQIRRDRFKSYRRRPK